MTKQKNNRFDIDFFEFYFLLETCIPNVPIARAMFWHKAIDKYYHVLTKDERERVWEWMNRNDSFINGIKNKNEDCELFYDRYNPFNQYLVKTLFKDKEDTVECFKYKDRYHTNRNTSVNEDCIKEIKKIEP